MSYAQPKAVGGSFSFSGIGLAYEHFLSPSCFVEGEVRTETGEYFLGRTDVPGFSASFTSNFILKEWTSSGGYTISLFAGAGATAGKSNDYKKDNGYFFGMKGRAGIECVLDRNISISMSLNPVVGSHLIVLEDHAKLEYYKNGLINLVMPEIGVRYAFGQVGTEGHSHQTGRSRFTFGAEWGYIGTFYSGYHYNFFAPEGYRVDPRGHGFTYASNGEVFLHAGYNLGEKSNLSVYLGFAAIEEHHSCIPISVRYTRYYKADKEGDRWFSFIDAGSGISIKERPQEILTGKVGGGYRICLGNAVNLDFLVSLRSVLTHPDIDYYGTGIPPDRINRNNAYSSAISVGMALTL